MCNSKKNRGIELTSTSHKDIVVKASRFKHMFQHRRESLAGSTIGAVEEVARHVLHPGRYRWLWIWNFKYIFLALKFESV